MAAAVAQAMGVGIEIDVAHVPQRELVRYAIEQGLDDE